MMAWFMLSAGIPHVILEKKPALTAHPQAHFINNRTMEVLTQIVQPSVVDARNPTLSARKIHSKHVCVVFDCPWYCALMAAGAQQVVLWQACILIICHNQWASAQSPLPPPAAPLLLPQSGGRCTLLTVSHALCASQVFRPLDGLASEVSGSSPPLAEWRKFVYCESMKGEVLGQVDHFPGAQHWRNGLEILDT